jgi:hypothetical protein
MKLCIPIFCLVLALLFTGCSNFTSPARKHKLDDNERYWLDYDASRRGAFVIANGDSFKTCAEPSPDVAYKLTEKLEASVNYKGVTAGGKGDFSQDVIKLAERTQMIMFLREALFRLCELSLNSNLDPKQYVALYKDVLDTYLNVTKADIKRAEVDKLKAESDRDKIKLETRKFLEKSDTP